MTITRKAYEKHDSVRTSIDLLCAGVSWRGGKFIAHESDVQGATLPAIPEESLVQLAKSMLLEGYAFVEVTKTESEVDVAQIPTPDASKGGTITTIERVESSLSPKGEPILEHVGSEIELYEMTLEQLSTNFAAAELLGYELSAIHSALAIPSSMLDNTRLTQIPVDTLMMGAIQYQSEVKQLRFNLQSGLNEVGE